jgi:hypothetical protein
MGDRFEISAQITARSPRCTVTPDERERMHTLCERIAKEQDQKKFSELVSQLNDLLDDKGQRLEPSSTKPASPRSS